MSPDYSPCSVDVCLLRGRPKMLRNIPGTSIPTNEDLMHMHLKSVGPSITEPPVGLLSPASTEGTKKVSSEGSAQPIGMPNARVRSRGALFAGSADRWCKRVARNSRRNRHTPIPIKDNVGRDASVRVARPTIS